MVLRAGITPRHRLLTSTKCRQMEGTQKKEGARRMPLTFTDVSADFQASLGLQT